ncbi:MAG TPA: hypothetical protein VIH03_03175 [Nitrososphaerales archaeon]
MSSLLRLSLLPDLLSLLFGFSSVIVIAIPFLKGRQIAMPSEKIIRSLVASLFSDAPIAADIENAVFQFNKDLWKAVREQRKYTAIGLVLLALSLVLHMISQVLR